MFERFTRRARGAVELAQRLATEAGADAVLPDHLLLALLEDTDSLAVRVLTTLDAPPPAVRESLVRSRGPAGRVDEEDAAALEAIGIDLNQVLRSVEENLGSTLGSSATGRRRPRFAKATKKALELALREALALEHSYIGTEHVLLGLSRGGDPATAGTFADLGITHEQLRRTIVAVLRRAG